MKEKPWKLMFIRHANRLSSSLTANHWGKNQQTVATKFMAVWQVPYQPGILKAVGYKGKKQVSISELKTAGEPVTDQNNG